MNVLTRSMERCSLRVIRRTPRNTTVLLVADSHACETHDIANLHTMPSNPLRSITPEFNDEARQRWICNVERGDTDLLTSFRHDLGDIARKKYKADDCVECAAAAAACSGGCGSATCGSNSITT